jgi:pilus assembly protein CpaD
MTVKSSPIAGRCGKARAARLALLLLAVASLSGCYTPNDQVTIPNDYRKRHPIALREGDRTVEVFVGSFRGGLTPAQRAEVLSFARNWHRESTGGVVIDVPQGMPNSLASSEAAREIRSILSAAGVPPNVVAIRSYQPENPARLSVLRMSYSKIVAESGPCGLWPHDLGPSTDPAYNENRPHWNLGCANQRNLAAMVANPADLVQPRGEQPAWQSRRTTTFERYRMGQSSETVYPNPDRGKLSDVGK